MQRHLRSFLVCLALLLTAAALVTPALGQAPPLKFGNNFFVTGDYIVAGAYNMNQKFTTINGTSYAIGTINVPDKNPKGVPNPGITGAASVPPGAQVVAALLYWQTVEKVGSPGSGQIGYFKPLMNANSFPAGFPGYLISGTNVSGSSTVSWSSGGCGGGSTGKLLRTYRADVAGGLPVDDSGNPIANTSFEVRLPSSGNSTPLTLGATLVVIYRILSGAGGPNIPLNSIVIYDGDYAQGNTQLTMIQKLQGFYDADHNPVSRLTHIVGSGQSNKFQTVYLSSGTDSFVALPFLYGKQLPAFPGWYGTWDNPTWTFSNASTTSPGVLEGDSNATTKVVPSMSNQGCVSWGAVIISTTVKNNDGDGILDSWKTDHGYCDASVNNGACTKGSSTDPGWVDLTGVAPGQKDIFLQYDYMCSKVQGPASSPNSCSTTNGDYSFDPRLAVDPADQKTAVEKVVDAFTNHTGGKPLALHAIPGNAIAENQSAVTCTDSSSNLTCPFPKESGTVGFREGLADIKNQNINPNTGFLCTPGTAGCGPVPVFQHGKKDSYHYALFSHGVGLPSWFLSDPTTLTSVQQTGRKVTFTTPLPHGIAHIAGDSGCPSSGRVTVIFAISNPNLNGTYCVTSVTTVVPYTFSITVGANASVSSATYTRKTDPNLAVANGQVTSMSGFSDVGGQNSVVSLGYGNWGPPNNPASDGNTWQTKAGTFMHELGHTLGLTHGGTFYKNLSNNDYTATFEPNCKPNLQSIMNYQFQVDLLTDGTGKQVVDYSKEPLPPLTKSSPQSQIQGILKDALYGNTAWFQLTDFVKQTFPNAKSMGAHCDGTPINTQTEQPTTYVSGAASSFFWSSANPTTGLDVNFDGNSTETLHGHDEWDGSAADIGVSPGLDLQQVSAVGTISAIGPGGEEGGLHPAGGGGGLHPAGGGGGLHPAGGGGGLHPAGGGGLKTDISHEQANAYTRPPRNLTATEDSSPRVIRLNWTVPTFGQIVQYNVYRAVGAGQFNFLKSVFPVPPATTFPPTTTTDSPSCSPAGYSYEVTASVNSDTQPGQLQESLPSNVVPAVDPLTGCYTAPVSFTLPASAVQGSSVQVTWTLTDDYYARNGAVTNLAANTLVAIGPVSTNGCATVTQGNIALVTKGVAQTAVDKFDNSGNQFTFTWNNTDAFCAGSYTFELDLDSGQNFKSAPLKLQIDVGDGDPHITTTSLPNWTAGVANSTTITQDGGVGTLIWSLDSGSLPPGISLNATTDTLSATLSGTSCVPGSYTFTVKVTDSAGNFGTQTLTLPVLAAPVAQVNQPLAPESSAPGGAGFALTVNGTGFDTCSAVQWNGSALATTFNSARQLTAAIPASDVATSGTASVNVTKTGSPSSNLDFFQITNPTTGVFLSQSNPVANTGLNPLGLIAGDFNADGKVDLAIANSGGSTVSILLGNGDGTFTAQPVLATGSVPYSLTAGDFNNDGKLDLAVTNFGASSTVSIFIGNGDGTFQPGVSYSVGSGPISVVTGDFNGDGKLDLAVANQNDHTVSILLGYGDGTFHLAVAYQAGTTDVAAVAMGDFNGDGKLDLALTNPSSDTVSVLLGNGDGTFQAPVTYPTGNSGDHPIAVSAVDVNGDGKLDLAVTNLNAKTVAILLGNGNGTFNPQVSYSTTGSAMSGPSAITTGDFNGDGKLDLAITGQQNNSVSILLGNGDGTFQNPLDFATGTLSAGVAAGDFNGDGRLDVAVANYTDSTVSVMLQAPHVLLAPSALAFGNVATGTSSSASVMTLTNDGSAALTISNIAIGGANAGDFSQNNNCPMSPSMLAAGSNCTINVTFTPTQAGDRSATLSITDNASGSPQVVNSTGSGFLAPPTSLTANADAGSGSVALAWSASPSAVGGYNVYRSTSSGTGYTQVASVPTTNFTDTVPSGTYYYVVTAVDASANQSAYSNEASATD